MDVNSPYRRITPTHAAPASASSILHDEEAIKNIVTGTLSRMLDLRPRPLQQTLPVRLYTLQLRLTGLLEGLERGEAQPRAFHAICDTIRAVLQAGDMEYVKEHAEEGDVKSDLEVYFKQLLGFALPVKQRYNVLVREALRDDRPFLVLDIIVNDLEGIDKQIVKSFWVDLKKHTGASHIRQRFERAISVWNKQDKPSLKELWQALGTVQRRLKRIRRNDGHDTDSERSCMEIGNSAVLTALEYSIALDTSKMSERSGGANPAFSWCISEGDPLPESEDAGLLPGAASSSIAEWLKEFSAIIGKIQELVKGDNSSKFSFAKQHIGKWQPEAKEGAAVLRLKSYDSNRTPSTVSDYEIPRALVEDLNKLNNKQQWGIRKLLDRYVAESLLTGAEKIWLEDGLDRLKQFSDVRASSSEPVGLSFRLAGFNPPEGSDSFDAPTDPGSFWAFSCTGGSPSQRPARLRSTISDSIIKSERALHYFSGFDLPIDRAEQAIGTSLSFYLHSITGADESTLRKLEIQAGEL